MAHQGERLARLDVALFSWTDRAVDHRHPGRAAGVVERAAPDPGRPGGREDVGRRLDRDAPRSQPADRRPRARRRRGLLVRGRAGGREDVGRRLDRDAPRSQPADRRPRARRRRGLLVRGRARSLRCAGVVLLHPLRRALRARAHRDPGHSPRAAVGGAAGARLGSAPVTTPAMTSRRGVLGAVLVIIGVPVLLALIEAVSFHVSNRSNGWFVSSGRKREYLLHVPKSYLPSKPTALVISLHGAGLWGAAQKETSRGNS